MDRIIREKVKAALLEILCELLERSMRLGYYPAIASDLDGFQVFNPIAGTFQPVLSTEESSQAQLNGRFSFCCQATAEGMRFEVMYSGGTRCEVVSSSYLPFAPTMAERKPA